MILVGGLSVIVGGVFVDSAADAESLQMLSGYATLGGVSFLISALRIRGQALIEPRTPSTA